MNRSSIAVYAILIILVSAAYLPMLYDKMFMDEVEKTHLFYSPVSHDFILKEKIVGKVPQAAQGMAEDHHSNIAYIKADGTYVPRKTFEQHLPFIFYKNMEIWGLLPITLNGCTFDKQTIKSNRRVLELKARDLPGKSPDVPFFPLLESNPGQARLVFPEDRFRMTDTAMEFIYARTNTLDTVLTKMYTITLKKRGFKFPARSVNGKFTVLKPFDEGVFIVDHNYRIFHIKRVDDKPLIKQTPIPPDLKIRAIKISENKQKQYYGLALAEDGRIFLLGYDNYRLTPIPLAGYDPDRMDLKLIFNPLYCTAVYSDETTIRAVAMDKNFTPVKTYEHTMSRATATAATHIREILFPFILKVGPTQQSGYVTARLLPGSLWSFTGMGLFTLLFVAGSKMMTGAWPGSLPIIIITLTGIYGLAAMTTATACE
ncbi:DUF4857 domain-containing protein [uncultured Desulfobacter sp.]|uniref:DUF4857 domain-containing protein n=1 Tax=uncultured Desulfobacter sp. TaxID=240139 RepID=UPI0029F4E656|nr:DUF4857 domain-containing protein [uncultured Desulfobacter sp.]